MKTTNSLTTRVAIVDDHQLVCACIAELLSSDPRISIVAKAHDESEAISVFARPDIDVVLLDLQLGRVNGLKFLQSKSSRMAACILTLHTEAHFVTESIRAGALGYVSKFAAPAELRDAVFAVSRGETFFSTDVQKCALALSLGTQGLSPRETEVLTHCAAGLSSEKVAKMLAISRRTAETHRANIFRKLSLNTQTELVLYALRVGIIAEDYSHPQPVLA